MTMNEVKSWLGYWERAGMVAVDKIKTIEDAVMARTFCECMRIGVFRPDLVSDLQILRAIADMRANNGFADEVSE